MPLIRTRCERIEGGRGYPRLKWSDLANSVVIDLEEPNLPDRLNLINGRSERNCLLPKEKRQVRKEGRECPDGALESSFHQREESLFSDPEESFSESDRFSDSNAETSLIYSRFRTNPDNGCVRMAFKVPLAKMTSLSNLSVTTKKENRQMNPSSTFHPQNRGSSSAPENNKFFTFGGNNNVESRLRLPVDSSKGSDQNDIYCYKSRNGDAKLPKSEIIYLKTKARRYKARCESTGVRSRNESDMVRPVDYDRFRVREDKVPILNTQNQGNFKDLLCHRDCCSKNLRARGAHRYKCSNKDPVHTHSFWHEIKTGGQSCLSSQRSRLREGTFIISPSENTSNILAETKRPQLCGNANKTSNKGSVPLLDRLYYLPKINLKFPPSNDKWNVTASPTIFQNALRPRAYTKGYNKSARGSYSDPVIFVARESEGLLYNGIKHREDLGDIRCVNVDLPYDAMELNYGHRAGEDNASCVPRSLLEVSYVPRSSSSRGPFLITSSSHVGLRCYPFVHCHPLPTNSAVYPRENCLHPVSKLYPDDSAFCYSTLTKYFPTVHNKPAGLTQCVTTQCHYSSRCPHHPHHYPRPLKPCLSKKHSPIQLGLTFRNRHAVLNSTDNLSAKKVLRKEAKTETSKKSWLSLLCLQNIVGQRNSSGVGTLPTLKPTSRSTLKNCVADNVSKFSSAKGSPVASYVSSSPSYTPKHQVVASTETKRSVKTVLKVVTCKKNLKTRIGSAIQPESGLASPVVLHGRISQKTVSGSPAPSSCLKANNGPTSSLTRFGFKHSSLITSGGSTDSVNSILSDAQTYSSSNSNICDLAEVNGNFSSHNNSTALQQANLNDKTHFDFDLDNDTTYQKFDNDIVEDYSVRSSRDTSPCTISQASSGVTSSAINGKLKAQTRQLPGPQIVTVRSFNCKNQSNLINNRPSHKSSPTLSYKKINSSINKNSSGLTQAKTSITPEITKRSITGRRNIIENGIDTHKKLVNTVIDSLMNEKDIKTSKCNFSLVMPKVQGSKIPQTKSSLQKSQKVSRDSDSSIKSLHTPDSGLGSSSESDKSKARDTADVKRQSRSVSGKDKDCVEDSVLGKEEKIDLDVSDIWLKEKHTSLNCKKSLGALDTSFGGAEKKQLKDSFKDKRDATITYGMARQKFAPYSRTRMSYQNAMSKSPSSVTNGNFSKTNIAQNGKVPITGVVRSRIAQIEKTPIRGNNPESISIKKPIPKKPFARPTTIEKTPIVVTSTSENTVELSKPICRMLEYSEAKNGRLETRKEDNKDLGEGIKENSSKDSSPTAQDFLIVASYEMKKDPNICNEQIKMLQFNSGNKKLPNSMQSVKTVCLKDFTSESNEAKRVKDMVECEYPLKRESEYTKISINERSCASENKKVEVIHAVGEMGQIDKVKLSPNESELSFEVLESPENEVSSVKETNTSRVNDYLSKLIVDMSQQCSESSSDNTKHSQESPIRVGSVKKSRSETFVNSHNDLSFPQLSNLVISEDSNPGQKKPVTYGSSQNSIHSSLLMDTSKSSVDSNGIENLNDTPRMSDSCERSGISGKCTPTLSNSNIDQDFLIDDEISDQPGLTFGDELDNSFLGDELLFPEEISAHSLLDLKTGLGRSRHESMGTTSNISGDDLMLDYEAEEHAASNGVPQNSNVNSSSTNEVSRPEHVHIVIPGRRYEEDVLSPVACDIFNEWTAMMAEVKEDVGSPLCHSSHDGTEADNSASTTADLASSAAFNYSSAVNAQQPLSNGFNSAAAGYRSQSFLSSSGCCRPKSYAGSAYDHLNDDHKKGHIFKPPRQGGSVSEQDKGVTLDRTSYHYICQDVTAMKTLLFRLRRILQVAETINPFDPSLNANIYMSLGASDIIGEHEEDSAVHLDQENVDLKRQVVLLQQRLEEKDRSIRILQQQLAQALQQHQQHCNSSTKSSQILISSTDSISTSSSNQLCSGRCDHSSSSDKTEISNAATQTERPSHQRSTLGLTSVPHSSTIEDGLGPTVSSEAVDSTEALSNHFESDFLVSENFCIKYPPVAVLSEVHLNSPGSKSSPVKGPADMEGSPLS